MRKKRLGTIVHPSMYQWPRTNDGWSSRRALSSPDSRLQTLDPRVFTKRKIRGELSSRLLNLVLEAMERRDTLPLRLFGVCETWRGRENHGQIGSFAIDSAYYLELIRKGLAKRRQSRLCQIESCAQNQRGHPRSAQVSL